jgi:hypothetical protein
MKKIFSILVILSLFFALIGCEVYSTAGKVTHDFRGTELQAAVDSNIPGITAADVDQFYMLVDDGSGTTIGAWLLVISDEEEVFFTGHGGDSDGIVPGFPYWSGEEATRVPAAIVGEYNGQSIWGVYAPKQEGHSNIGWKSFKAGDGWDELQLQDYVTFTW